MGPFNIFWELKLIEAYQEYFFLKKYTFDILCEYHMQSCKPLKLPLDPNAKLHTDFGDPLSHPVFY